MNKLVLLAVFCMYCSGIFSQEKPLTLNLSRNEDRSLSCNYTKNAPGTYFVKIKVNELDNSFYPMNDYVVKNSSGVLFTLKPSDSSKNIRFSYSYITSLGKPCEEVDSLFTYLLPFNAGVKAEYRDLSYLGNKFFDQELPDNFKAFQFFVDSAETICSVRKGLVVKVVDSFDSDTSNVYSFSDRRNEVIVEHNDGTLSQYVGFAKGRIFVKPGDVVNPNTPLGELTKYDKGGKYQLRFSLYFRNRKELDVSSAFVKEKKSPFAYISPYFLTSEGICQLEPKKLYVTDINDEIFTKEFSKKEWKRWKNPK